MARPKIKAPVDHRMMVWALVEANRDKCAICGEDDRSVLDFHHRDPKSKKFNISSAVQSRSLEAVTNELAKCVVLCANCHRRVHAGKVSLP